MSFLDSLENDLKAMENREQAGIEDRGQREAERNRARAAAPWAEKLKASPWTAGLIRLATREGFQRRTKVNLAWIGTTLRLEARDLRLELQPRPEGVFAVFLDGREERRSEAVDFEGDPGSLVAPWMTMLDERRSLDEARAAELAEAE